MHLGYISFGGEELANTERLQAYVDNGLVPDGTKVHACDECQGLGAAVEGPSYVAYRTPQLDQPSWFDPDDPDTWDFAGVLPLTITGADSSVATVEVTATTSDGGVPGRRIRGPRTIGVTAMLIGRTTEAVEAGLLWLERTLHRVCDDTLPCPGIADVSMFTTCPGPIEEDYSATATPVTTTADEDDPDWTACGGYTELDGWVEFYPAAADNAIDGGSPDGPWELDPLDGGDPDGPWDGEEVDGGSPFPIAGEGAGSLVAMTTRTSSYLGGPLTIAWDMALLAGAGDDHSVQLAIVDPYTCEVLVAGPHVALLATYSMNPQTFSWEIAAGLINCDEPWAPAVLSDMPFGVEEVRGSWQPPVDPADCIAPYRRTFPRAVVAAGPTVVEWVSNGDCGRFARVEWIWQVTSPYRVGTERVLIEGLRNADVPTPDPTYADPEVEYGTNGGFATDDATDCPAPLSPATDCADDPGYPSWTAPPALPAVPDPDRVVVGTNNVSRVWLIIPPAVTPTSEGVLTIALRADEVLEPKVGVRVRVYVTDAEFPVDVELDPCSFEYEYHIDYIPGGGVLTIDGRTGLITTLCNATTVPVDSSNLVRGNYDGPVQAPVIKCDQRYMVVVDHLEEYPRTVPGVYTAGDLQGLMSADISLSLRDG